MNQENQMGSKKMLPLIITMSLPPMLSMLIQSLYNIIDSIFVARLSESALSAVSIIFPMQNLTLSVAVGAGVGVNAYIARNLGAGRSQKANSACILSFLLTAVHYIAIALLCGLAMKPFVYSFTKDSEVIRLCLDYGYLVIFFSFGQLFHIMVEKIFQANGKMLIPMILQGAGCVVNIILDPLLIFGLGGFPALGVKGAAIATVMGQMISCFLGLVLFALGKSGIRLHKPEKHAFDQTMLKQIYGVAIPSILIMALPSVLVAGLNRILIGFSTLAVSVFGIYFKLQTFVYMPANGLIQGIRPVIAYNYGAGNKKRETDAIRISLIIVGSMMLAGTLLFWILPVPIMSIFKADVPMKQMGVTALKIISIGFIPSALSIITSAVFESIGQGFQSLMITLLRQLVILLPLSFILTNFIGLSGVWISFPVAEAAAALISAFLLKSGLRLPAAAGINNS